jgi:subfamily B ATP-binding cassette protein HlyB/CyaB
MRLAQLWTEFQQTGISVQRLGDILNTRTEIAGNKNALPALTGRITLDDVVFRYRPDGPEVLKNLSLDINAGEVIGIVGRSGSGKSTLTKLIQRLYVPERGRVLVDGMDCSLADSSSLRRQIGVVLQENMLFARSIRDNIAYGKPDATDSEIEAAAQKANALAFIQSFPEGMQTLVGDRGIQLSGGQRQRIAIARAVLRNPRILLLDEATSSLDNESEKLVQEALDELMKGRTSLVIAHRLSTIRNADRIVVLENGIVTDTGTHNELLERENGLYRKLIELSRNEQ